MTPAELAALAEGLVPILREMFAARDARLAALEARAALPGRDGRDGLHGEKGAQGAPGPEGPAGPAGEKGAPGLTLTGADFARAAYDVETRTLTLAFGAGETVVEQAIPLPVPIHRGVWQEGTLYAAADMVTHGGSIRIAGAETNARPSEFFGEGPKAWTLAAKRGRDGKAGKDGAAGKDSAEYLRLVREARL